MSKPLVNFVHANGFPAGSYQTFFSYLENDFNIVANAQYGHDHRFRWHKNWQHLVDELIHFVSEQQQPVISVGHSFGGVITFIAACQRPDLFRAILLLDPPVVTGHKAWLLKLVKPTGYIDKLTPAGKAQIRRRVWPLGSDIAGQFAKRQLFRNFDPRCLKDYVDSAIKEKSQQLELNFLPEIEADIFRNVPTNLSRYKNKLLVPATFIYGENSKVCPKSRVMHFASLNKMIVKKLANADHMFPLEQPENAANFIRKSIFELIKA